MFKAWVKGNRILGKFNSWCPVLEAEVINDEKLRRDLKYELERKIIEEIKKFIEMEIDKEVCRKIAKEFIEKFDVKPILEEGIKQKFENYIQGLIPGNQPNNLLDAQYQQMNAIQSRRY